MRDAPTLDDLYGCGAEEADSLAIHEEQLMTLISALRNRGLVVMPATISEPVRCGAFTVQPILYNAITKELARTKEEIDGDTKGLG